MQSMRGFLGPNRVPPFVACTALLAEPYALAGADPLPSWSDTAPKKAIVAFVEQVTKAGAPTSYR